MNKANQNKTNIEPRQVLLYRNVFYSRVSTAVVLCLCLSFLLQPIERIYAFENANPEPETSVVNMAVDAGLSDSSEEEAPESEAVAEPTILEDTTAVVEDEQASADTSSEEAETATTTDTDNGEDITESDNENSDTATTTVFTDEEIDELINPEDELPETELNESTTTATTTTTTNAVAVSTVHSDAVMQFNRNDCVTVEDGSFYCQSKKEEAEQGTDGMYALQDKDGDLEIFLQKNGELKQLTFNTIDDAAPVFDAKSNTIVWHRLVDERYQIISYDLETGNEVQLTADNVNNMEPSRSGKYIVWQRWHNDNWDIVLYDGTETKYLTENPLHDIAPNVKGDLVMWNRLSTDNTQSIELYDLATEEFTTITDAEGGALSNPRMVLVYETEFANGDIVTKGYDVETGEVTPLANNPAELPEELPEPDATGETRALVQPKNPTKEDSDLSDGTFPTTDGPAPSNGTATATSTPTIEAGDLVISSSTPVVPVAPTSTSALPESNMTLDLTPAPTGNPDIPTDLVVPPFIPESPALTIVIQE